MQVTAFWFGFMIRKWQIGDQNHNKGELRYHPEASWHGFETSTGKLSFSGDRAGQAGTGVDSSIQDRLILGSAGELTLTLVPQDLINPSGTELGVRRQCLARHAPAYRDAGCGASVRATRNSPRRQ